MAGVVWVCECGMAAIITNHNPYRCVCDVDRCSQYIYLGMAGYMCMAGCLYRMAFSHYHVTTNATIPF